MHHVFISYSRVDSGWVDALVVELERHGVDVWIDRRHIPPSVDWMEEVNRAIEEAALFVACESEAFHRSITCPIEVALAQDLRIPRLDVATGAAPAVVAARVVDRLLAESHPLRARRTELRVLARDWRDNGRHRRDLVGWRLRRRLARSSRVEPRLHEFEVTFLRESRARTRRRVMVFACVILMALGGTGAYVRYRAERALVDALNLQRSLSYQEQSSGLDVVMKDPYSGLALAAQLGYDEADVHAQVISEALRHRTPDDAFTLPAAGSRFVVRPVSDDVVIADAGGRLWHRPASARDTRVAQPWPRAVPASGASTIGVTAQRVVGSGAVTVHKAGRLWRTVYFGAPPAAVALSPNQRFLAAAVGSEIQIADIQSGQIRTGMRGAPGALRDIAWTADSTRIWGVANEWVTSWPLSDAMTVLDDPASAFNAILPTGQEHHWWIGASHSLAKVDLRTRQILARIEIPDTLIAAAADSGGKMALASGQDHAWIVPLADGRPIQRLDAANCSYGRPVFVDAGTAYLPCINGDLLTVDIGQGAVVRRIALPPNGGFGVAVLPGTTTAMVGDSMGTVYAVTSKGTTQLVTSACNAVASRVAISANGRHLLPVGSGTGLGVCSRVATRTEHDPSTAAGWQWSSILVPDRSSIAATAATFSANGDTYAIGFSNGSVSLHPTVNLTPSMTFGAAAGSVRDLVMTPGGGLLIATDGGMLLRLPLCAGCLSNAALAKVAAGRLDTAKRLGLAVTKPA